MLVRSREQINTHEVPRTRSLGEEVGSLEPTCTAREGEVVHQQKPSVTWQPHLWEEPRRVRQQPQQHSHTVQVPVTGKWRSHKDM